MTNPWTSPLQPRRPPRSPSDPHPRNIVVGVILEASQGPCYRLRTDDGADCQLHGGTGERLERGAVVRAVIEAWADPRAGTACCPASPGRLVRIEQV